jgi:hypothetical protein
MGAKWRDCIVTMIDLCGTTSLAHTGRASTVMRRLHALVIKEIGSLRAIDRAYTWNDSVLLLSYVDRTHASFEAGSRTSWLS